MNCYILVQKHFPMTAEVFLFFKPGIQFYLTPCIARLTKLTICIMQLLS